MPLLGFIKSLFEFFWGEKWGNLFFGDHLRRTTVHNILLTIDTTISKLRVFAPPSCLSRDTQVASI